MIAAEFGKLSQSCYFLVEQRPRLSPAAMLSEWFNDFDCWKINIEACSFCCRSVRFAITHTSYWWCLLIPMLRRTAFALRPPSLRLKVRVINRCEKWCFTITKVLHGICPYHNGCDRCMSDRSDDFTVASCTHRFPKVRHLPISTTFCWRLWTSRTDQVIDSLIIYVFANGLLTA